MGGPRRDACGGASRVRRAGRPAAFAVALVALVVAGAACAPVLHPVYTPVEPATAPVRVQDLSSDGRYALVSANGASATVPGAGTWRVDRQDGTAVALPGGRYLVHSQDLRRVLIPPSGSDPASVWEDGVVTPAPVGAVLSTDLRWALAWDAGIGRYRRVELATGADTVVDSGYPLAPGVTHAPPPVGSGIADGGNIAWFRLDTPSGCATRFVLIAQGQVFDHPNCTITVAASGTSYLVESDYVSWVYPHWSGYEGYRRVEQWQTVRPAAPARVLEHTSDEAMSYGNITLSDDGWAFWATEYGDAYGVGPTPIRIVSGSPADLATFSIDDMTATLPPAYAPGTGNLTVDVTPSGRWLAFTFGCVGFMCGPKGPVTVLDRATGHVEQLVSGPAYTYQLAISGDASVVAYSTANANLVPTGIFDAGWFEYTADPGAGL